MAIVKRFVRNPYNYDLVAASNEEALDGARSGPSLTQQSFAEEVDINTIVKRFGLDGDLPVGVRMPVYGDFTGIGNFQQAANAVIAAEESFAAMPARVRSRFGNDAGAFVQFCGDPANARELAELGLVKPEVYDRIQAEKRAEALAAARKLVAEAEPKPAPAGAPAASEAAPAQS